MGATISTGKKVAAFARGNGDLVFALFEQTYEGNCYPHTPRWSCVALGLNEEIMDAIFKIGSVCEGGLLRYRNGAAKPENYIESWLKELANPFELPDQIVRIRVGSDWSGPIPEEARNDAFTVLRSRGKLNWLVDLDAGRTVELRLHDDIDTILQLYGTKSAIAPWRILQHTDTGTERRPGLAPLPLRGEVQVPDFEVYRLGQSNVISRTGSEPFMNLGWDYSAVAHVVIHVACEAEMRSKGAGKKVIEMFRVRVKEAAVLPPDTRIVVSRLAPDLTSWSLVSIDRFARKVVGFEESLAVPDVFEVRMADVLAADAVDDLARLSPQAVAWHPVSQPRQLSLVA